MVGGMSPAGRGDDANAPGDLKRRDDAAPAADQLGTIGQLRASHQDRDRVVEVLRVAAGDGRLTADELDQRLEAALTARTYADLAVLTTDLPAASTPAPPVPQVPVPGAAVPEPKDVGRIECGSGSTKRDGRWVVPRRMEVRVASGAVRLDFTEALISQPSLQIDTEVHSGQLILITKPGIAVDADEVEIRSGRVKVTQPWGHDEPVSLRIVVNGKIGSGRIVARPPRRTFWQWLTRRRPARAAAPR
jgi:Domain of unknown function (DUF1707)